MSWGSPGGTQAAVWSGDTASSDRSPVPFLLFVHFSPVKIVVTRTLLITADLLVGLALATLLLGLDCTKFLKEEPHVKLKMCYGAGIILGIGSMWPGALGDSWDTGSQKPLQGGALGSRRFYGLLLTGPIPPRYPGSRGLRVVCSGCLRGEGHAGVPQSLPGGPL